MSRLIRLSLFLLFFSNLVGPWTLAQQVSARGVLGPYHDVTLSVTVSGIVSRVFLKEGDTIRAGEPIVELQNNLEALETERRRLIWQDRTVLEEVQARFSTLSDQLAHTESLYRSTHSVSEDDLQKERLQVRLAELEVNRLEMAEQQEKLDYQIAEARLEQRTIVAPFDGVVASLSVDVGDACTPGEAIARIVDLSKCRLVVHVEAAVSRALHTGTAARVAVNGFGPSRIFRAIIEYVAPVVDPSSGLREVKAVFDNTEGGILPGLTGTLLSP